jgi:hypothetical protein
MVAEFQGLLGEPIDVHALVAHMSCFLSCIIERLLSSLVHRVS